MFFLPSVLWHGWFGVRKSIQPVKVEWWSVGVVFCLEWGAYCLHMAQLMPLPYIQAGFTFLVPAHLGSPGKRVVKWMCVCVCVLSDRIWKASCHFVIVRRWATACLFKRWIRQTFHWLWRNASTLLQYMVCDAVFTSCCSLSSKIWTDTNFLKYIFYNVIWVWWWIKKGWGQWLFFLVWISAFRV